MVEQLRDGWKKAAAMLDRGVFAAGVLHDTGVLGALRPTGLAAFARAVRGQSIGPHLTLLLHARNTPHKLALVDGARRMTYGELDVEINRMCRALLNLGVASGDRVALMLPNSAEYLIAQAALPRIGGFAVQIGVRLKRDEVAHILTDAEPSAVIYHHQFTDVAEAAVERAGLPAHALVVGAPPADDSLAATRYEDAVAEHPGDPPPPAPRGEVGGVIVYTSGTTGKPKGANRRYRDTGLEAAFDLMARIGMRHDDRQLVTCPLYHSAAPAFVSLSWVLGATIHVEPHFDERAVLATIAREGITCAFMVPTMLRRLADVPAEERQRHDTSSLRWVLSGSAPLTTDTANAFQAAYGHVLWNFYGATETGLVSLAGPQDHAERPGTVGTLLRGNEIQITGETGDECETGDIGELWARNAMLIAGYHRNAAATSKSMQDGFFSVGDLARCDADGYVFLASRKHDMVISGGVNIYPREIEDHLLGHPDIVDVAVVGVPDEAWGEALKAFVVARAGSQLSPEQVVAFCREGLADYKRPRTVVFLDELPRSPIGKVLKRELRER